MHRKHVIVNTDAHLDDICALLFLAIHPHVTPTVLVDQKGSPLASNERLRRCLALLLAAAQSHPTRIRSMNGRQIRALLSSPTAPPVDYLSIGSMSPMVEPLRMITATRLGRRVRPSINTLLIMGGAIRKGNATPASEYNFHIDAQSADRALQSVHHIPTHAPTHVKLLTWDACLTHGAIDIERYLPPDTMNDIRMICNPHIAPLDEAIIAVCERILNPDNIDDIAQTGADKNANERKSGHRERGRGHRKHRHDREIRRARSNYNPLLLLLACLLHISKRAFVPHNGATHCIPDLLAAILLCHPHIAAHARHAQLRVRVNDGTENGRCIWQTGNGIQLILKLRANAIDNILGALFHGLRRNPLQRTPLQRTQ